MRNLISTFVAAFALSFIGQVTAQTNVIATWDVEQVGAEDVIAIELDVRTDRVYFLVNGIVLSSTNSARSAVGSCYPIFTGDLVCELQVRNHVYTLYIDENLNGTLEIADIGQNVIEEGILIFRQ